MSLQHRNTLVNVGEPKGSAQVPREAFLDSRNCSWFARHSSELSELSVLMVRISGERIRVEPGTQVERLHPYAGVLYLQNTALETSTRLMD
jgi:hypothetical protein